MSRKGPNGPNDLTQSSLEVNSNDNFARCPEGHGLPHKGDNGRCTPLYCAVNTNQPRVRVRTKLEVDEDATPEEARLAKVTHDEVIRTKIQLERQQVWQKFMGIPVDLKGADAEKYADEQLVDMLPFAVGVLKKQLMFGTDEQQERAATKVLDANGRGKREGMGSTAPSIIINMGGSNNGTPPTVVQGQVVTGPILPWRKAKAVEAVVPPSDKKEEP